METDDEKRVRLEKLHFAITKKIKEEFWGNVRVYENDDMMGSVFQTFVFEMAGKELKTYRISYPVNWWEAFKDRWFPTWMKNRWPVQERTHTINLKVVYPKLKLPLRGDKLIINYEISREWNDGVIRGILSDTLYDVDDLLKEPINETKEELISRLLPTFKELQDQGEISIES